MKTSDIQIRDPFILPEPGEGFYYLFGTTDKNCWKGPGQGFDCFRSRDLCEWEGPIPAFRPPLSFWGRDNFWAPEVHRFNDRYYMFASFKSDRRYRGTQILVSDCVSGPYVPLTEGPITPPDWECLDGTLHVDSAGKPWIVFSHEWVQVHNGAIYAMQLSPDLRMPAGRPVFLFNASEAPWVSRPDWPKEDARPGFPTYVTDGPFLYRNRNGILLMLWSSLGNKGYAMGIARSESGDITGPWKQDDLPLWAEDGGHGMIFRGFDGRLFVTFHMPNKTPMERPVFIEIEDTETGICLKSAGCSQESRPRPIVGAIRWDAWTGGGVTEQVERTLGPKKYHERLPWFAEVVGDDKVRIDGSPQNIMDQEIDFAADAGLDYWAFLMYPESESMSGAIKHYLKSSRRKRINFCVILHNAFGVSDEQWPKERDRAVALMKEPGYQTVLGGRPLVYSFAVNFQGTAPRDRFADFRGAAQRAGLNPYCVFMGWNPERDFKTESARGFDAVSAYAFGSEQAAFAQLAQSVENDFWQNAARADVPYVPLVTTGWDKRPRKDNPVSWEKDHDYHRQNVFPSTATPQEIASHLNRAIAFVREHSRICAANAIIVYSWNEHDEGGWLEPTWTQNGRPDTGRLDAIRGILKTGLN